MVARGVFEVGEERRFGDAAEGVHGAAGDVGEGFLLHESALHQKLRMIHLCERSMISVERFERAAGLDAVDVLLD